MQGTPAGRERLSAMFRIRFFEDEISNLRRDSLVVGSVHLCSGQEAIYVGACTALDLSRDAVFPTYRGHGWALACGAPLDAMFAELLGREAGTNGGRGGSAYLSTPDQGMFGENSIVGAGAPIATGAALAGRYDGSDRVTVAAFGDGAINQGSVTEAMNFAAYLRLPVVFLIENNLYSELTPTAAMVANDRLYTRGNAMGVKGVRVDGNDVDAVADTMSEAVLHARSGKGPVLLEAMTQRLVGHYIGDAEQYRAPGERERAAAVEPLVRLSQKLRAHGVTTDELASIEETARQDVLDARERALASPVADPSTVLEHLYA
ncbi:MAG: acetoin dehydrogenase [Aeromicrobium sp.]|jgi:TPP-dependent pyruvate/acetoin dehydrogenase alpha subunit|nr:acetoin dehydrogenase [Aeromicrobium sp.]